MKKYINLIGKSINYLRINGFYMFLRRVKSEMNQRLCKNKTADAGLFLEALKVFQAAKKNEKINKSKFESTNAIKFYHSSINSNSCRRVNLITDSINSGSLFGGVGTSLLLGVLLANKLKSNLRIITRTESANPRELERFLSIYNIHPLFDVEFKYMHFLNRENELDAGCNDIYLTTSWWTTSALLNSQITQKLYYILQEDERMFYPFGDDRQRCESVLRNDSINFILNTKLLYQHFVSEGFDSIVKNGTWFEPAFPSEIYYPRIKKREDRKKLFYYARPNNPRNLFYLGLDVLDRCVLEKAIDLDVWDIYFVGKDIPKTILGIDYEPKILSDLSWAQYAEFIGGVDLGLSLMYTPHPSYPPLDLAASGAKVVTNKYGIKSDLLQYSSNIKCADLNVDSLVECVKVTVIEIENQERSIHRTDTMQKSWVSSFENIIKEIN